ncbi:G patch domain and ankyrin repeat-containing protein 1 homolog [Amborella trichopoda]|uniref:G-patch domain-containing protein n=1 Tax=Amborella trichopoda TaxID=13333 RepID=W1PSK7_AMBTC|nr:G patch domain and ankyrin repeat-containing protein 1 homolog [Amborella trichopoda]XP_020525644.1 G patch domain and ankyrin repeat-containing protein 1 homolog [Amborella trichopoda]ERN10230.1 hypothetical protein AMTR_s00171p00056020 [Amborella trichopoda]|eukprot:XP_006848649.1 G patch domain and ankyrin repeat-containing protein 1 homolog [Amborella trichopoda]
MGDELVSNNRAIDSSNIGFQLLKKCGWKEGTGLGTSEQGRLEPVETHVKKNKRGLGADKVKQSTNQHPGVAKNTGEKKSKKFKALSKRMRKLQEEEARLQEKQFVREFFMEFWSDNV